MNKEFININGVVVIGGEKGIIKTMPNSDFVEEILITENELSLLQKYFDVDSKTAVSKEKERDYRLRSFKKLIPVANTAAVAAAVFCSFFFTLGVETAAKVQDNIFGQIIPFKNLLSMTLPAAVISATAISCIELLFRPSLEEIAGYQEMARYESEAIKEKSLLLEHLQSKVNNNDNNRNTNNYAPSIFTDFFVYPVNDSQAIKVIKEMRDLRYSYGKRKAQFLAYPTEKLASDLANNNFTPETISQFLVFIEKEKAAEQEIQKNNEIPTKRKK